MKRNILIISFISLTIALWAQKVTFQAVTQNVVAVGEQFQLSYKLNDQGTNFKAPNMPGFRVLAGPNVSNSSSISYVNGQMTREINQTYNFVLQATKVGKQTIQSAHVKVDGKSYKSNAVKIEVVKKSNKPKQSKDDEGIDRNDLFIKIVSSKRSVYIGEPISLTLKVYTKLDLVDLQNAEFPEYKGFYSQDIKTPENITLQRENVKGQIYSTALLDKVLLYPQKTGKLKIDAAKIDAIIRKKAQRRGRRNMMDEFFGGGYKQYRIPLESQPLTITVKDLPSKKPASFTGAVGNFKVAASIDNPDLKANDAFTYKLKISGSGNIKLLKDPELDFPHDFDVWEPTISNKVNNTPTGSKGSKTYEYVIQPRHPGQFTIPAFEFSYFDVKLKKYKTVKSESFDINVSAGDQQLTSVNPAAYSKEDVELIGKDIRYIKTGELNLKPKSEPFFGQVQYWLSFFSGIIIFVIIFLIRRKQINVASDSVLLKNKKAKKEAIKRLKLANDYLKNDKNEGFYDEIIRGVQGYLSDKLNIPQSDFTLEKALESLNERHVSEDLLKQLKEVIQECEFARFAPSQATMDLQQIYTTSVNLISEFENKIKRKTLS